MTFAGGIRSVLTPDNITLLLGGRQYNTWQRYRIDSDFLKGADAWQLQLGLPDQVFPVDAVRGAPVKVKVRDEVILTGRIDSVRRDVSRKGLTLLLSGRDLAAILVDCAAPIFSARQLTLDEGIAAIVRPLGITRIRIQAQGMTRHDSIHLEPGERAWDALIKLASGRGLWPWMDPDGTLVIGGPDYTAPPVATLVLSREPGKSNVMSLSDTRNIQGCFSDLTVLAQSHALPGGGEKFAPVDVTAPLDGDVSVDDGLQMDDTSGETGHYNRSHTEHDPTVPYYRPQIIITGDIDNRQQLEYKARKAMADARLSGLDVVTQVSGHRTPDGVLWTPGQRVRVISEPHGTDEILFLMGRTFSGGLPDGQITQLRFKEDGIWIPDAYPSQKRGKKHAKNETAVVPVWE
ncbi:phage tail protein [Salmonella enterica]|nr:phage tail protein [Salmonella enterica]EAY8716897.1 phage tail protein [Salmonella enterica]EBQ1578999.1 phage tail protein [Salmonella enterica]